MSFAGNWMELEIIMLSQISQTQKDKYLMFSLICRIYIFKKDMKVERVMLGRGRRCGGGRIREGYGVNMIKIYMYEIFIKKPIVLYN
jgi:hypothetical protein